MGSDGSGDGAKLQVVTDLGKVKAELQREFTRRGHLFGNQERLWWDLDTALTWTTLSR